MKQGLVLALICALAAPLAVAEDTVNPDDGLLIIDIRAGFSNESGPMHGSGAWVKNLKTGKTYGSRRDTLQLLVLPEGIYCVDDIVLFPRGMGEASYCGEPYIKVVRGKLSNAGQWVFVVDLKSGGITLKSSTANPEETLQDAKKKFPDYF